MRASKWVRRTYKTLQSLGIGVTGLIFVVLILTLGPVIVQEIKYEYRKWQKPDYTLQNEETSKILAVQNEAESYGVSSHFSVVIPKIEAYANITANVDPNIKAEYLDALAHGVAHAKGTYFPGQLGRTFLFSHSTDSVLNFKQYNAVFYLLRKLEKGDQIIVFFADNKYVYEVEELKNVSVKDTSWIAPNPGVEELVLMTCDPPGTTWRRLLVIAKPVEQVIKVVKV